MTFSGNAAITQAGGVLLAKEGVRQYLNGNTKYVFGIEPDVDGRDWEGDPAAMFVKHGYSCNLYITYESNEQYKSKTYARKYYN